GTLPGLGGVRQARSARLARGLAFRSATQARWAFARHCRRAHPPRLQAAEVAVDRGQPTAKLSCELSVLADMRIPRVIGLVSLILATACISSAVAKPVIEHLRWRLLATNASAEGAGRYIWVDRNGQSNASWRVIDEQTHTATAITPPCQAPLSDYFAGQWWLRDCGT